MWSEVDALCRQERAIFLKVEPDMWQQPGVQFPQGELPGFRASPHSIQPPRTILVDLHGSEEEVLGRMRQKTRYNIHLAQKKEVVVRTSAAIDQFEQLMQATGQRDGFAVHGAAYYQKAYDLFAPTDRCALLIATYEGQPLAGLMVFRRGRTAWYLYGASNEKGRNRMPTYLLQWEAMRWARERGCTEYDLWGVPDADEDVLENNFSTRSDGLWGVYRFKRGFGGVLRRTVGAWDRVYNPELYAAYRWWINRRGRAETAG
jgi:peptidoglycan pentaglycine glycine transferase (the first glycine)